MGICVWLQEKVYFHGIVRYERFRLLDWGMKDMEPPLHGGWRLMNREHVKVGTETVIQPAYEATHICLSIFP